MSRCARNSSARKSRRRSSGLTLSIEPDVFHAPAVVDAVRRNRQPLDIGVAAIAGRRVEDHRPSAIIDHLLLDLPDQLLALLLIAFHRLLIDELIELGVAITAVVPLGATDIVLVEGLIRVIHPIADKAQRDREVPPAEPRKPLRRVDRLQLGVDIHLLQLVDQNDGGIAERRKCRVSII